MKLTAEEVARIAFAGARDSSSMELSIPLAAAREISCAVARILSFPPTSDRDDRMANAVALPAIRNAIENLTHAIEALEATPDSPDRMSLRLSSTIEIAVQSVSLGNRFGGPHPHQKKKPK